MKVAWGSFSLPPGFGPARRAKRGGSPEGLPHEPGALC